MSATERLLAAIVDIQHYITHDIDPDKCAACPRWDELQSAAMEAVAEIGRLQLAYDDQHSVASLMSQEVEKAEAEVERLKEDYHNACKTVVQVHAAATGRPGEGPFLGVIEDAAAVCAERDALQAEVERLRADAERYRWLRDVATGDEWDYIMTTEDTDAAIDAARGGAMSRIINGREYFCGEEIEQSFTRWRDARIEELEAEVERLRARDEEWQRKASAWMASPEAAQRLDGYRELAQRVNAAEEAAARGKK